MMNYIYFYNIIDIIKMIKFYLIIPISNAEIERTFSTLAYLKNDLRNRLLDDTLNDLLFIFKQKIS